MARLGACRKAGFSGVGEDVRRVFPRPLDVAAVRGDGCHAGMIRRMTMAVSVALAVAFSMGAAMAAPCDGARAPVSAGGMPVVVWVVLGGLAAGVILIIVLARRERVRREAEVRARLAAEAEAKARRAIEEPVMAASVGGRKACGPAVGRHGDLVF